ncbi:hypothetical protein SAMN05216201_10996 [Pseudomonas linyingensis]|uniref:Uncharacterized protein n=1 Tax=Pseudomonas linyingensis TaxID=915471 RepID=A0A1H6Z657_9PSED|nr:hypothetical protein [Pseudomonas linyingensis]SEJ46907.1 hypothetical protein SAMN05216201_10996 [Pseudomonas linyingensis]
MKLALAGFRGELPIIDERLLPEANAQVARNVYLRRGTLKPERAPGAVTGLPGIIAPSSLYRYPSGNNGAGFWMAWGSGKRVHAVKSMLADDAWSRVYWTGDGAPKVGGIGEITAGAQPWPSSSFRLGIPAPAAAPTTSAPAGRVPLDEQPITAVQAYYVVTLISRFGEEGPPSPPSGAIVRWDMVEDAPAGGNVEIALPGVPSGAHDIVSKRIYRAESAGVYQFVGDVTAAAGSFTDSVPSENMGVALPSIEWDMPDSRMVGLTALPGGFMAGYFDNTLCFCEAYRPHAWPVSYQLAFTEDIVGISAVAGGLVVATNGRPHMVTGSSPAAMADSHLDEDQPCLSGRSLVDMGEFAVYASPNGLVAVGGGQARLLTAGMIGKDQWLALQPETIHGYRYDGRYLAFYQGGCFTFTPGEGFEFFDIGAESGYYDLADDTLYLIQGGSITAWGKGQPMTLRWRSKVHEIPPGAAGFTCGKLIAREYPATLRLFADGAKVFELAVPDARLFRLPAGYTLSRDWEIEIEGETEVLSVQIASSPSEIV